MFQHRIFFKTYNAKHFDDFAFINFIALIAHSQQEVYGFGKKQLNLARPSNLNILQPSTHPYWANCLAGSKALAGGHLKTIIQNLIRLETILRDKFVIAWL